MTNREAIETIKIAIAEVEWNYPMDYAIAFDMAIEALEKQTTSERIPCSERLPECEWGAETKALLYQRKTSNPTKSDICTGYFGRGGSIRDNYFRTYADTTEGVDASDVIAWMPLPEPYEEKEM